jgi:hypothetical protein
MFPMQLAMCTKGPSLPRDKPDATERAKPSDFVKRVRPPRYPWITNPVGRDISTQLPIKLLMQALPERMVLISGIPEPAA